MFGRVISPAAAFLRKRRTAGVEGAVAIMDISTLKPNQGKQINITTKDYGTYARYPVKTHVVVSGDSLEKSWTTMSARICRRAI